VDPKQDINETINIEGDPEDVMRVLLGVGDDSEDDSDGGE
jgi:hypothetical protein